jgi:hypothetical protein
MIQSVADNHACLFDNGHVRLSRKVLHSTKGTVADFLSMLKFSINASIWFIFDDKLNSSIDWLEVEVWSLYQLRNSVLSSDSSSVMYRLEMEFGMAVYAACFLEMYY